ncbi:MAG: deoxyribonuclease IV [Mollicutes bacterium]|nr:deoxyribonuclease IV [Mollicutes bacterium]
MLLIGSHVSFEKEQLLGCVKQIISYGGNTFMFYTGAPQNTIRRTIDDNLNQEAINLMKENNIYYDKIVCHAPYIINLANNLDINKYEFSIRFLRNEIDRCEALGIKYIVIHPGSALSLDKSVAINNIINALNKVISQDDEIMILLETMAGKGTECGINNEELKAIISGINFKDKIGVCLDTCHLNDSGVNMSEFDNYLSSFEQVIGLEKIKCIHINDSKNNIFSKKDRHANIGFGTLGFDNLLKIIYHEKLKDVPKILETPFVNDKPPYRHEIDMIKNKEFNPNLISDIINS